jgi:lysosomal alpha-glucosidase
MQNADFPLDVQWTDIDAMSSFLDFTYDSKNFHNLPEFVRALQAEGVHYVNIIDPGISSTESAGSYFPYDDGIKRGIFMTKYNSTELIIGKVILKVLRLLFVFTFIFSQGLARKNCIP